MAAGSQAAGSQLDIRALILRVVEEMTPTHPTGQSLQHHLVLREVARRLGGRNDGTLQRAILTAFHDLMRTGYFAWGLDVDNPNPPFFHVTDVGRRTLRQLARDPGNPAGYARHLAAIGPLDAIAQAYITEGLACYNAGLHKAAAVMIGAAAERLILDLRDSAAARLTELQQPVPKALLDWRIKIAADGLHDLFDAKRSHLPKDVREAIDAYWPAFVQQIRTTRNDAGHPTSVDPVTEDAVHAACLLFPEIVRLHARMLAWLPLMR